MTVLVLVRHGRTVPDPSTPASTWPLAEHDLPAGFADKVGACEVWLSSPEPKAQQTAALLSDHPVKVDERLREVGRGGHLDDYDAAVDHHFSDLDRPAAEGWETGRAARARLAEFIDDLSERGGVRVAAVTHGLVMTHLHALLTGESPDLERWRQLDMPDVRIYELSTTGARRQTQAMRTQVIDDISRRIRDAVTAVDGRTALVAVDGVDGAGKTHFADELAQALRSAGTEVLRASVDGFHHPPEVRYRRGRGSPEGFYRDSYDLESLRRLLLEPVRRGTGEPVVTGVHDVATEQALSPTPVVPPRGGVLLFDGIFLHRPELIDLWDRTIWVDVPFSVSVPRGAARDGTDPDPSAPSQRRYVEGQRLYLAESSPRAKATIVVDNADLDQPRITADRTATTS